MKKVHELEELDSYGRGLDPYQPRSYLRRELAPGLVTTPVSVGYSLDGFGGEEIHNSPNLSGRVTRRRNLLTDDNGWSNASLMNDFVGFRYIGDWSGV